MSRIALRVLCIVMNSVSCERFFAKMEHVIEDHRTNLHCSKAGTIAFIAANRDYQPESSDSSKPRKRPASACSSSEVANKVVALSSGSPSGFDSNNSSTVHIGLNYQRSQAAVVTVPTNQESASA